jgi:hypothetical protein
MLGFVRADYAWTGMSYGSFFERAIMHSDVALHYNDGEAHTMNLLPQLY